MADHSAQHTTFGEQALDTQTNVATAHAEDARPLWPALRRGWKRRCPSCGANTLFEGYLKTSEACPACGQEFHHHRADDGPAYITILIVGHLMAPVMHIYFVSLRPDPLVMASVLTVACAALALYMLPRVKGALVAIQWSKRMHGFATDQSGQEAWPPIAEDSNDTTGQHRTPD